MNESRRPLLILIGAILAVSAATQLWGWQQERQIGRELASAAKPGDILMVASDTCSYCAMARAFMQEHAVPFKECSIERDPACAAQYAAYKAPGTPVIVVRGEPQVGFMPGKVLQRLSRG